MDYRVGPGRSGLRTPPLLFLKKDPHRPCLFRAKKGRGGGGGPGGRKSTTPPKELKPRQGRGGIRGGEGPTVPTFFTLKKTGVGPPFSLAARLQEKNPLLLVCLAIGVSLSRRRDWERRAQPTTVSAISADDKQLEKPENKISLYAETF